MPVREISRAPWHGSCDLSVVEKYSPGGLKLTTWSGDWKGFPAVVGWCAVPIPGAAVWSDVGHQGDGPDADDRWNPIVGVRPFVKLRTLLFPPGKAGPDFGGSGQSLSDAKSDVSEVPTIV